jgi:predicted RNase H-like nuclease
MTTVAGVDGCKAGWIAVIDCLGAPLAAEVRRSFADVLGALPGDAIIAVDMPIGLPERIGPDGRGPEHAIRQFLGKRKSSVFSIPSRKAVYAEEGPFADWEAMRAARRRADRVARRTSDPSKGLSFRAFALFPRIREIDTLLRSDRALAGRVFESHPEAVFAVLNGMEPMELSKKVSNRPHPAGMAERRAFLVGCRLAPGFLVETPARAAEDDFLDACVLMLAARRIARGEARCHPGVPGRDGHGLPIAIWT